MAAINKAFIPDDDFKETSSRQDRPTLNKGTVCHVDIEGIDDSGAPKLSQILATLPGNFDDKTSRLSLYITTC